MTPLLWLGYSVGTAVALASAVLLIRLAWLVGEVVMAWIISPMRK